MQPAVGLLFFVPGINETLRVNGRARIATDPELLADRAARGRVPSAGLVIAVEQAFFHCGKALIRSKLWDGEAQVERGAFPTLGRVVAEQTRMMPVAEAEAAIEVGYRERLY
jgi:predicted pyridoxine 5'-phosphate oxidase superfamily flavin-nucleotide-binding protein